MRDVYITDYLHTDPYNNVNAAYLARQEKQTPTPSSFSHTLPQNTTGIPETHRPVLELLLASMHFIRRVRIKTVIIWKPRRMMLLPDIYLQFLCAPHYRLYPSAPV